MSFTDAKPTDSKESLLNDIMIAAANQSHMPGLPLRPFAALVVKVADETAETVADLKVHITKLNEQNAKLQWWVVALAVAALVGTFVQTAAALYALTAPNPSSAAPAAATTGNSPATPSQALQPAAQPAATTIAPAGAVVGATGGAKSASSPPSAATSGIQR